jgi:hypothetical protein
LELGAAQQTPVGNGAGVHDVATAPVWFKEHEHVPALAVHPNGLHMHDVWLLGHPGSAQHSAELNDDVSHAVALGLAPTTHVQPVTPCVQSMPGD